MISMQLLTFLPRFSLLVAIHCVLLGAQEMFPMGNFDKLMRGNSSIGHDSVPVNGAHLPRLTLIKQRILHALGRENEKEPQRKHMTPTILPKSFIVRKQPSTSPPVPVTDESSDESRINEIVTFSETISDENGNAIIRFRHHNHHGSKDVEAVGASLLLYINRSRKIRKGGRGKKIILTVTEYDSDSNPEEILTYLRTRVKRRRWKKLSLPLSVAKNFLNSGDKGLSLKVKCVGCGRLVQLMFINSPHPHSDSHNSKKRKRERNKGNEESLRRKKKRRTRRKTDISTRPILVISTRTRQKSS